MVIKEGIIVINVKSSPFEFVEYVGYSGAICVVAAVFVYDWVCCTGAMLAEGGIGVAVGSGLSQVVYHFSTPGVG